MAEPEELLEPEQISPEMLKDLFTDAFMDASIDKDGDVQVVETYRSYVVPGNENKWIRVYAIFGYNEAATLEDKMDFVNRVNAELVIVRAYVDTTGRFIFEHYLPVEGGITRKAVVLATRRFHRLLEAAIRKDEKNVIS
jgi:hypothetical protein